MIMLSLERINENAPYYVMLSPKGNYIFETERGIHYSVSFEEETPFGECETYQFILENFIRCSGEQARSVVIRVKKSHKLLRRLSMNNVG